MRDFGRQISEVRIQETDEKMMRLPRPEFSGLAMTGRRAYCNTPLRVAG